jgi:hypothetical protein
MHGDAGRHVVLVDRTDQRIEICSDDPLAQPPAIGCRRSGTAGRNTHRLDSGQIRGVIVVGVGRWCSAHGQHKPDHKERRVFHATDTNGENRIGSPSNRVAQVRHTRCFEHPDEFLALARPAT